MHLFFIFVDVGIIFAYLVIERTVSMTQPSEGSVFQKILSFIKNSYVRIRGRFAEPLPLGLTEFNDWSNSIILAYDLPGNDSTYFTLAVMILHMPAGLDAYPKCKVAAQVRKAMSNQVVSQVIQDLKAKQEAAIKAAQQPVEATTQPATAASTDVQQQPV
jgi:hypothetical protein